jgi:hypothetical protein
MIVVGGPPSFYDPEPDYVVNDIGPNVYAKNRTGETISGWVDVYNPTQSTVHYLTLGTGEYVYGLINTFCETVSISPRVSTTITGNYSVWTTTTDSDSRPTLTTSNTAGNLTGVTTPTDSYSRTQVGLSTSVTNEVSYVYGAEITDSYSYQYGPNPEDTVSGTYVIGNEQGYTVNTTRAVNAYTYYTVTRDAYQGGANAVLSYYAGPDEVLVLISADSFTPICNFSTATSFAFLPKLTTRTRGTWDFYPQGHSDTFYGNFNPPPKSTITLAIANQGYSGFTTISKRAALDRVPATTFSVSSYALEKPFMASGTASVVSVSGWANAHSETGEVEVGSTSYNTQWDREDYYSISMETYTRSVNAGANYVEPLTTEGINGGYTFFANSLAFKAEIPTIPFNTWDKTSGALWYTGSAEVTIPNWSHVAGGRLNNLIPYPVGTSSIVTATTNATGGFDSIGSNDYTTITLSFDTLGHCYSTWSITDSRNADAANSVTSSVKTSSGSMMLQTSEAFPAYPKYMNGIVAGLGYTPNVIGGMPEVNRSYTVFNNIGVVGGLIVSGNASTTGTFTRLYGNEKNAGEVGFGQPISEWAGMSAASFSSTMDDAVSVIWPIEMVKGYGIKAIPRIWA